MKRMSIKRQNEAMKILSKYHAYDLDFNMNLEYDYSLRVNNISVTSDCEIMELRQAGFFVSITTNLGHTDDGYGFQLSVYQA